MKKRTLLILASVMGFLTLPAVAQNDMAMEYPEKSGNTGFYLGAQASTNGWGFNARYSVTKWLSFKAGYETLSLKYNFNFNEYDIEYNADMNYKTGGISLLADLNYTRNLYVSTGVVLNSFNPSLEGFALSDYAFGDIVIPAEKIGNFTMEIEPGLKASPYVAAGFQSFLGKAKRLVFNFETGIYYMGAPQFSITSDGLLAPTSNPDQGQTEYLEDQFSAYTIYPVIKINLAYQIF